MSKVSAAAESIDNQVRKTLQKLEHQHQLLRSDADQRPVVLMTCGVSGAGKSTLSKALVARHPNFLRLSMDAIIAEKHGIYSRDYSPSLLDTYQDEAEVIFRSNLENTLKEGRRDIVLDRAFYAKEDRDEFTALIRRLGGRCVLVYLPVPEEELWRRIGERRATGVDADSARVIERDLLRDFVKGFEVPNGEGEVVIQSA